METEIVIAGKEAILCDTHLPEVQTIILSWTILSLIQTHGCKDLKPGLGKVAAVFYGNIYMYLRKWECVETELWWGGGGFEFKVLFLQSPFLWMLAEHKF